MSRAASELQPAAVPNDNAAVKPLAKSLWVRIDSALIVTFSRRTWVNALDFARFKTAFGSSTGNAAYNPDLDADGNGSINTLGYAQFKKRFGLAFSYT